MYICLTKIIFIMKIVSWNVNGIRAVAKKGLFDKIHQLKPDIMCFQETKAQDNQVSEVFENIEDYHLFSNSAEKKGYSGTAILSKIKPINVFSDIGIEKHDKEGRVLTAEYKDFFLTCLYTPNSKNDLSRLDDRQDFDKAFLDFIVELDKQKPVIVCGDFNVAHKEIDLARPKANYNKSAGYMQEEINGMDNYTSSGFTDVFRTLNPDLSDSYTWWSYRAGARERNVGWRIDYFIVSNKIVSDVKKSRIHSEIFGSDHCPISIEL